MDLIAATRSFFFLTYSGREYLWMIGAGFHGLVALPVTQPTMSKSWREFKALSTTSEKSSTGFLLYSSSNYLLERDMKLYSWPLSRDSTQLVSWSLPSLFSTNTAISEMKGQGWRVIITMWRQASNILTSTLAATQKGKGIDRLI